MLRAARGPGSITLPSREPRVVDLLRAARGPGSITLGHKIWNGCLELRAARGPGSITLHGVVSAVPLRLRAARGPGSITLLQMSAYCTQSLRAARGPGSITLGNTLKFADTGCELHAGRDRLHYGEPLQTVTEVASCTRAGIDYTCTTVIACRSCIASCTRAGIDYTRFGLCRLLPLLRAARGPGSITLATTRLESRASCELHAGRDRLHCPCGHHLERVVASCTRAGIDYTHQRIHQELAQVASCTRAGIDYTWRWHGRQRPALRAARGPGSITLPLP